MFAEWTKGRRSSQIGAPKKKGAGASNTCPPILERIFTMPILPYSDLTAMTTGRDTKALTTSIVRSQTLLWSGYKMRRLSAGIVEVKGQPTEHKTRSGGIRIDPHGPYTVNTIARTCTCAGFANRGLCAHLPAAIAFHQAWERGESPEIRMVTYSKQLIALREIEGTRYHCEDRRIVVFRDWEAAADYWQEDGVRQITEPVELTSQDLEELAATRKYAGLLLQTAEDAQPIPLPEVDWKARGQREASELRRGGFTKREDFD